MEPNFNSPNLTSSRPALTKLSSAEFDFSFIKADGGVDVALLQVSTGKTKNFFIAGTFTQEGLGDLNNHMNSLTDDLCSQWFNVRVVKKKEKKNV
jgi:hypothetical protein